MTGRREGAFADRCTQSVWANEECAVIVSRAESVNVRPSARGVRAAGQPLNSKAKSGRYILRGAVGSYPVAWIVDDVDRYKQSLSRSMTIEKAKSMHE